MCSLDGRSQKLLTPLLGWVWKRKRVELTRAATLNYEESQRSPIQIFLVGVKSLGNCLGELSEIVQVMATDLKDDVPINRLIAMNGNVSESDRFGHALAERGIDELKVLERLEILRHRGGWMRVSLGDQMGGQIDGKLDGTLKIQGDDVLQVRVLCQLISRRRRLSRNSLDATSERFQFGLD
jgi:hypothetical protein